MDTKGEIYAPLAASNVWWWKRHIEQVRMFTRPDFRVDFNSMERGQESMVDQVFDVFKFVMNAPTVSIELLQLAFRRFSPPAIPAKQKIQEVIHFALEHSRSPGLELILDTRPDEPALDEPWPIELFPRQQDTGISRLLMQFETQHLLPTISFAMPSIKELHLSFVRQCGLITPPLVDFIITGFAQSLEVLTLNYFYIAKEVNFLEDLIDKLPHLKDLQLHYGCGGMRLTTLSCVQKFTRLFHHPTITSLKLYRVRMSVYRLAPYFDKLLKDVAKKTQLLQILHQPTPFSPQYRRNFSLNEVMQTVRQRVYVNVHRAHWWATICVGIAFLRANSSSFLRCSVRPLLPLILPFMHTLLTFRPNDYHEINGQEKMVAKMNDVRLWQFIQDSSFSYHHLQASNFYDASPDREYKLPYVSKQIKKRQRLANYNF